jgi:hypothetical protein
VAAPEIEVAISMTRPKIRLGVFTARIVSDDLTFGK